MKQEKKKKKKNKKKNTFSNDISIILLWSVFVFLIFVVVALGYKVYLKGQSGEENKVANLRIPIVEKDFEFEFGIQALSLLQEEEYTFKIVNYRGDEVLEEDLSYSIVIENTTGAAIKVFKNDESVNLMKEQAKTEIENGAIKGGKKGEDIYHVIMISSQKLSKDDIIQIKVIS